MSNVNIPFGYGDRWECKSCGGKLTTTEDPKICPHCLDGAMSLRLMEPITKEFHGKPATLLGGNSWIQVYAFQDSGYTFSHEPKWNDVGVGILPYAIGEDGEISFLAVREKRPVHGDIFKTYALTGGYDDSSITPAQCALKELQEESGFVASPDRLTYFGMFNTTKMSTATMHLFAINVTGLKQGDRTTDGSMVEQNAYPLWIGFKELILEGDNLLSKMANLLFLQLKGLHTFPKEI